MDVDRPDGSYHGQTEDGDTRSGAGYVSTGHLPSARQVRRAIDEAYRLYGPEDSGQASQTYPALARVPGHLFGICVAGIAVSPGKGGLGTFSPLLDEAGNSVRGQLAARYLSRTLGLSLFASKAERPSPAPSSQPDTVRIGQPGRAN